MIQHHRASEDCKCGPREVPQYKQASRGRYGRHQGYQVTLIEWRHNPTITEEKEA